MTKDDASLQTRRKPQPGIKDLQTCFRCGAARIVRDYPSSVRHESGDSRQSGILRKRTVMLSGSFLENRPKTVFSPSRQILLNSCSSGAYHRKVDAGRHLVVLLNYERPWQRKRRMRITGSAAILRNHLRTGRKEERLQRKSVTNPRAEPAVAVMSKTAGRPWASLWLEKYPRNPTKAAANWTAPSPTKSGVAVLLRFF